MRVPVRGFEGLYEISDDGHVFRMAGFWCRKNRELKRHNSNTGYLRVCFTHKRRNPIKKTVHRLVYEHFNGPIPPGMTVNHINGTKHDNRAANLALATMNEQMVHAYANGLQKVQRGSARGKKVAKLTESDVLKIRDMYARKMATYAQIAELFNVSLSTIGFIVRRRRWAHI